MPTPCSSFVFRRLGAIAGAAGVGMLLTAPFLVPFAEAVLRSQRFGEMRGPRETIVPPYSDFPSAVLLLHPRFFGELPIAAAGTDHAGVRMRLRLLAIVATIAAAISLITRRRWRDRETLYILGAIFSVGVVLGWPMITELFRALAGLAPTMRMRLGICFGSALLAPVVDEARRNIRLPLLIATLVVSAAISLSCARPRSRRRRSATRPTVPAAEHRRSRRRGGGSGAPDRARAVRGADLLRAGDPPRLLGNPRARRVSSPPRHSGPRCQRLQQGETTMFRILGTGGRRLSLQRRGDVRSRRTCASTLTADARLRSVSSPNRWAGTRRSTTRSGITSPPRLYSPR